MWSDLGTTHLLPVGDLPDQPVKIPVGHGAQVEVGDDGSQHPGVGLSHPLGSGFDLELVYNILSKEG